MSATGGHPISVSSSSWNQFLLIDITALVQGWVSGTVPNNGVALALTTSTGSFSFDSKESLLTGNGPEQEIVLSGGGPQGPLDRRVHRGRRERKAPKVLRVRLDHRDKLAQPDHRELKGRLEQRVHKDCRVSRGPPELMARPDRAVQRARKDREAD